MKKIKTTKLSFEKLTVLEFKDLKVINGGKNGDIVTGTDTTSNCNGGGGSSVDCLAAPHP
jgi:natural product precursor